MIGSNNNLKFLFSPQKFLKNTSLPARIILWTKPFENFSFISFILIVKKMILKIFLLSLFASQAWSQAIDLMTGNRVSNAWMELGFTTIDTSSWMRVDTTGYYFKNAVIILGLPDLGGHNYTTGHATATRIRNVVNTGGVHFEVKVSFSFFFCNDYFSSQFLNFFFLFFFFSNCSYINQMTLIVPNNGMFPSLLVLIKLVGLFLNMVLI